MFWRIIGIVSLIWGAVAFFILSTTSLPTSPEVNIQKSVEFTIYILSVGWFISSILVKVGLILNRRWIKVSLFSCVCFIFMLLNMGLIQKGLTQQLPTPPETPSSLYPYNIVAIWFVSWFWIDLTVLMITWMRRKFNLDKMGG